MHRIRLDIDSSTLEELLSQHALSIEHFNWVDEEGKAEIRAMFLKVAASQLSRRGCPRGRS